MLRRPSNTDPADATLLRTHRTLGEASDATLLRSGGADPAEATMVRPSPTADEAEATTLRLGARTSSGPPTLLRASERTLPAEDSPARGRPDWESTRLRPPPVGWASGEPVEIPADPPGWSPPPADPATSAFSPESENAGHEPQYLPEVVVPQVRRDQDENVGDTTLFQQPAEEPPPPVRTSPVKLWMVLTAALVVVATFAGVMLWRANRPVWIDPSLSGTDKPTVAYQRGDQVVSDYLKALAAGDIDKALSLGPRGGHGSEVLLQQAAIRASIQDSPISNIQVPPADENASLINASYQVGSQAVPAVFRVVRGDDRSWRLAKVTTTVQITARRSNRLPLYINGVEVPPNINEVELVPGSYTLSTKLPFVSYLPDTKFTVQNLDYTNPIKDLPVAITDQGKQALIKASLTSLNNCMNSHTLSDLSCPFRWKNDSTDFAPDPSTISYTPQEADPISGATWTVSASDQALAQAVVRIAGVMKFKFKNNPSSSINPYDQPWMITADITKLRAEDLDIQWNVAR